MSELNDLWIGLVNGLWGFPKDYLTSYNTQLLIHNFREQVTALEHGKGGKKYRPKPFVKMNRLYPDFDYFLTGGKDNTDVDQINNKFKNFFRLHGSKV